MKRTLALILMLGGAWVGAAPQDFAFTYQGELRYNQQPVNDQCDLAFGLHDAASGGIELGVIQPVDGVLISDGLFTVDLDFGDIYDGDELFLEIGIGAGCGDPAATEETLPRTLLTSAPYSSYAMTSAVADAVDWSGVANRPPGLDDGDDDTPPIVYSAGPGLTLNGTSFELNPTYRLPQSCSDGEIPVWTNDAWVCGIDEDRTDFWAPDGNAGTTPGTDFIGTVDNQALEIKVNGTRALRIEPNAFNSPNILGGHPSNNAAAGVAGATIGGGGAQDYANVASESFSTVGGGLDNLAGQQATVGGGASNDASGDWSAIGGGAHNTASASMATVGGGFVNVVTGNSSIIGGGEGNSAAGPFAVIGGGLNNAAHNFGSVIGGGEANTSRGSFSAVLSGTSNVTVGFADLVLGGYLNIAGADSDPALPEICFNGIDDDFDAEIDEADCEVGLGSGSFAVVNGGTSNKASGRLSVVGGGHFNRAFGTWSIVSGGLINQALGVFSAISQGEQNVARGAYSTAAGSYAEARLWGQRAFSAAPFIEELGAAQSSAYTLSNLTTDAAPTNLYLDGASQLLTIPVDLNMTFDLQVAATVSGSLTYYGYAVRGVAQNDSGTIYLSLDAPFESGNGAGTWSTSVVANSVDASLDIVVTGAASTTIRWVATVRATEVMFP